MAWQRIENPGKLVKVNDKVKAKIISLSNSRISLSLKELQDDPWEDI
ncbi:MAG: 30S ribosomal protein S1, partial [Candidatus Portnoybacteria bacterium CG23_combo_of_CG06-09_8_20_14_all_37_13]